MEKVAACRICAGQCSLRFSLDSQGNITRVRSDKENPLTRGFTCVKGLTAHEAHYSPDRLRHPLRRKKNGEFERVALTDALDEIAERVSGILERDGSDAVAGFRGTMSYCDSVGNRMLPDWLASMGSHSFFSTMTIDQSAKWITADRLGSWAAGKDPFEKADVTLLFGTNPLVSQSTFNMPLQNPLRRLQEAKARGLKLIVIDPRETETARHADILLQPKPGEDVAIAAGLLNVIFQNDWQDTEFCEAYSSGADALKKAVEPFTPDYVEQRAGLPSGSIVKTAELFAGPQGAHRKRGSAASGTGPNMALRSNLAEHLIECLNVVCGRFAREGEFVANPGVLGPRFQKRAEVYPPTRSWESGWRDGDGFGLVFGERMSATLPQSILGDSAGKVRALFIDGGNPANAMPGVAETRKALSALELLVVIDPFMTETASLADFVFSPLLMWERSDIGSVDFETHIVQHPYAQYSEAVISPPKDAEIIDSWRLYWEIARRTDHQISFCGVELDNQTPPTREALIDILLRNSAVPRESIRAATGGEIFDVEPMKIAERESPARFDVAPKDILEEIEAVLHDKPSEGAFKFSVRRMREVQNTMYHQIPSVAKRRSDNPVWMHPEDISSLGLQDGALVTLRSAHGELQGRIEADETMRAGVVSMTHGWGDGGGVNVNYLTSLYTDREKINAMPILTGFNVEIEPA